MIPIADLLNQEVDIASVSTMLEHDTSMQTRIAEHINSQRWGSDAANEDVPRYLAGPKHYP